MTKPLILIADDQADVRQALSLLLRDSEYQVATAASPAEVLSSLRQSRPDLVLLDLNFQRDTTSGAEGLALLKEIRAQDAELPVVILTGWATVQVAVQAMQLGAQDFLEKPWENARVRSLVANQLTLASTRAQLRRLAESRHEQGADDAPVFQSQAMGEVMEIAARVAASNAPVLLSGESGTGKGLLARWIHQHSARMDQVFVSVNLGGLAETLFESELFGHVKGAFTDARGDRMGRFESASGGTLLLDEISNIPTVQQARLLHVLEEGRYERVGETASRTMDARILAATNADIHKLIREGRFREDLYFRLNTVEIALPPLRARRDDIALLAGHYLSRYAREHGRNTMKLTDAARRALECYDWPGNVRELAHVMQRAVLLAQGEQIEAADLRLAGSDTAERLDNLTLEQAERYVIRRALESCGGDVNAAADKLGVSRSALYRRLEKLRQ
ncbi:MAG: sigma-54-dependent Fis family transcriptional regulator [Gammaproteobacteria bacterium]|nr:sigma-54-dependent Fis family transcriptional regulator [Gammaproteobacteria bacterium]